jgi:hypothetical protein
MTRMPCGPPHRFVEQQRDDSAMRHSCPALVSLWDLEINTRAIWPGHEDKAQAFCVERTAAKAVTVESNFHFSLGSSMCP